MEILFSDVKSQYTHQVLTLTSIENVILEIILSNDSDIRA